MRISFTGLLTILFLFATALHITAQTNLTIAQTKSKRKDVRWASQLIYVTGSWKENGPFSAEQLLGRPSLQSFVGTRNPCAWTSDKEINDDESIRQISNSDDVIRVAFDSALLAKQVAVVEAFNPSAVTQITLFSEAGESQVVYSAKPSMRGKNGRILCVFFPQTSFPVIEAEIRLQTSALQEWNQIDAIAISSSTDSVRAEILTVSYADKLSITPLDGAINSEYGETAPVISPDGKELYFARYKHPDNIEGSSATDIWFSQIAPDGKTFSAPVNLGAPLNDVHPNFVCTITPDGGAMLVANEICPRFGAKTWGSHFRCAHPKVGASPNYKMFSKTIIARVKDIIASHQIEKSYSLAPNAMIQKVD
jgi:hypothetical protein